MALLQHVHMCAEQIYLSTASILTHLSCRVLVHGSSLCSSVPFLCFHIRFCIPSTIPSHPPERISICHSSGRTCAIALVKRCKRRSKCSNETGPHTALHSQTTVSHLGHMTYSSHKPPKKAVTYITSHLKKPWFLCAGWELHVSPPGPALERCVQTTRSSTVTLHPFSFPHKASRCQKMSVTSIWAWFFQNAIILATYQKPDEGVTDRIRHRLSG